jgi:hypothetical protein
MIEWTDCSRSPESAHEIKRRLIKADEIMRAPSVEMFVLARDFAQPIRCFTPRTSVTRTSREGWRGTDSRTQPQNEARAEDTA